MGAGGAAERAAGGGRAARALRLLLLLVLALAAVEYLFGSILDASPLRTYLYTPIYNATQPTMRNIEKSSALWPKKLQYTELTHNPETRNFTHAKNKTLVYLAQKNNYTNNGTAINMTRHDNTDDLSTPLLITKIMEGLKNLVTTDDGEIKRNDSDLPICDLPPDLGPISMNKTELELDWVEKKFPAVHWGGRYAPPNCTARHKVAIIVPYRDRQQHLAMFLNHMHPFLMKQQIEYGIFIIEQEGNHDFNRAKLMNVGFVESQKLKAGGWQCFIFHDIDLLPLDERNMYSCPRQPRHMSASIDKLNFRFGMCEENDEIRRNEECVYVVCKDREAWRSIISNYPVGIYRENILPYEDIFGGVSAMTQEQFTKVNGFSNKYWGWGGEDDDMFYRLKKMNYHVARYKMSVARYAMLDHKKSAPNPKRYQLLSQTSKTFQKDGLSTLEYEVVQVTQHHLYTHILANIDERS